VHHHGVDFKKLTLRLSGRPSRKIIAVGRLSSYKGFDYLLRAIHELKRRGIMGIDVEFVGDGPQLESLKSLATSLDIQERTTFRGWLTSDEACAAMQQATILVHPSPELNDGVPNVIKEAMAVGTPVIGSDIAGIPELLDKGRCGVIVPPRDVMALANAIEALLANPTMREEYAQAAYSHAQRKFDLWQNGQLLAHLLASHKRLQKSQALLA
jgi:colanic acid/amylovoran biosynthesis glycosyltransferase